MSRDLNVAAPVWTVFENISSFVVTGILLRLSIVQLTPRSQHSLS